MKKTLFGLVFLVCLVPSVVHANFGRTSFIASRTGHFNSVAYRGFGYRSSFINAYPSSFVSSAYVQPATFIQQYPIYQIPVVSAVAVQQAYCPPAFVQQVPVYQQQVVQAPCYQQAPSYAPPSAPAQLPTYAPPPVAAPLPAPSYAPVTTPYCTGSVAQVSAAQVTVAQAPVYQAPIYQAPIATPYYAPSYAAASVVSYATPFLFSRNYAFNHHRANFLGPRVNPLGGFRTGFATPFAGVRFGGRIR